MFWDISYKKWFEFIYKTFRYKRKVIYFDFYLLITINNRIAFVKEKTIVQKSNEKSSIFKYLIMEIGRNTNKNIMSINQMQFFLYSVQ